MSPTVFSMSTLLPWRLRPPLHHLAARLVSSTTTRRASTEVVTRSASSREHSSAPPPAAPQTNLRRLADAPVLTALYNTHQILPKILKSESGEFKFWNDLLTQVAAELEGTKPSNSIRIVVCPIDALSTADARALVEALLEDPFADDSQYERLSHRWEKRKQTGQLEIQYGTDLTETVSSLTVQSSFLTSRELPIRITELASLPSQDAPDVYAADIPIYVINPLQTPLSLPSLLSTPNELFPHPIPPHSLVVVSTASPTAIPTSIFDKYPGLRILPLDPARALSAVESLRSSPSSPIHIQRYQDDTLGSNLPALRALLSPGEHEPDQNVHSQKATALLKACRIVLQRSLRDAEAEITDVRGVARTLRGECVRAREDALRSVFGLADAQSEAVVQSKEADPHRASSRAVETEDKVRLGFERAERIIRPYVDNSDMAWWKVVWSPEEVGWRVRAAVRAGWAELERAVLPSLSTLPQTQARLTDLTLSRLPAPPSPLASPVLQNALDQLRTAPTYAVQPTALLAPLSGRRNVLENGVTGALERAAQGLALWVFGSTGAGLGAGGVWIAWKEGAEWLVGSSAGDAAMSAAADAVQLSQTVGTGAGVGLLIALGGTRWAIGEWERAKKDWWGGWRRTAAGGERDMRTTLERVLDQQVLVVPARANRGLQGLAERRAEEVKNLSSRLDELS